MKNGEKNIGFHTFVGVLFGHYLLCCCRGKTERVYFAIKNRAGYNLISPYITHEFPNKVFSIQIPEEAIEALKNNPNLEFRGYASRWDLNPRPRCGDGKCNGGETAASCPADCSASPDPSTGGRACLLSHYGLEEVQYGVEQI